MEERLWNVACDLAVELLIWQNIPENLWQYPSEELQKRRQIFEFIDQKLLCTGTLSASETGKTPF